MRERLFSSRKPEIRFPVDLAAEIRAKGESARPWVKVEFRPFWEYSVPKIRLSFDKCVECEKPWDGHATFDDTGEPLCKPCTMKAWREDFQPS